MKKLAVNVNMFNKQYLYNIVSFFSGKLDLKRGVGDE